MPKGGFAFEFNINSVRAVFQASKWHLIHGNRTMQSGVINEILLEILIVFCIFFFFLVPIHLFLENIIYVAKSPFRYAAYLLYANQYIDQHDDRVSDLTNHEDILVIFPIHRRGSYTCLNDKPLVNLFLMDCTALWPMCCLIAIFI